MESYSKGHSIYMDKFYNCIELTVNLLARQKERTSYNTFAEGGCVYLNDIMTEENHRNGKEGSIREPRSILNYNEFVGRINHNDKIMAYYLCKKQQLTSIRKWKFISSNKCC
ncbi:hypothetical protein J437_LFUL005944 [Ladona fulva]|uniref:PiggyBac transposable element-derived protein domain-containing protein n=1 Tax=Ladona fulva TaxID=123851 RepID=A0A8K0NXN4_LADFU|nr:hypothetical protein J437_LFUL005944 [Ladona fulva]